MLKKTTPLSTFDSMVRNVVSAIYPIHGLTCPYLGLRLGSSYLGVFGTLVPDGDLNSPNIFCFIDGRQLEMFLPGGPNSGPMNNMLACSTRSTEGASSPGEHELLINVTNISNTTQW